MYKNSSLNKANSRKNHKISCTHLEGLMTNTWKQILLSFMALGIAGSMLSGCGSSDNVLTYFTTGGTFTAAAGTGMVGTAGGADVAVAPADAGVTTVITGGTILHDAAAGGGAVVAGTITSSVSVSAYAFNLTT